MYAHECDLMCMCKVQYHMPPVCLELLITTVSLWICSIQEVVPPETMLQTVYPKSLQMQRSKLNICVGNKAAAKSDLCFLFLLFLLQKNSESWRVLRSIKDLELFQALSRSSSDTSSSSLPECEGNGAVRPVKDSATGSFLANKLWRDGGKTKDNHKSVKSMERRKWNFASCSLRGGPNQLIATKDISPTRSALYYIYWIYWQSKIKKS